MKTSVHVDQNGNMVNWLADQFWLAKRDYERRQEIQRQLEIRRAKTKQSKVLTRPAAVR